MEYAWTIFSTKAQLLPLFSYFWFLTAVFHWRCAKWIFPHWCKCLWIDVLLKDESHLCFFSRKVQISRRWEVCFDCHGNLIPRLIISSSSATAASSASRSPLVSTTAAASSSPSSSSTTELWSNKSKEMKMRLLWCKHCDLHNMDTSDPVTSPKKKTIYMYLWADANFNFFLTELQDIFQGLWMIVPIL